MKEFIKKNKELIVAIVIVLIIIISGSYAWFKIQKTSETVNKIKVGNLELKLDDSASEGIKLINEVPMSYQQGMATKEYTFTLTNSSSIAMDYTISLEDIATYVDDSGNKVTINQEEKLGDNVIRFMLLKNGEKAQAVNSKLLSQDPGRAIDTGVIAGNNTQYTYSLRIWIDSKAGDNQKENEIMGKKFNAGLTIKAEQARG